MLNKRGINDTKFIVVPESQLGYGYCEPEEPLQYYGEYRVKTLPVPEV